MSAVGGGTFSCVGIISSQLATRMKMNSATASGTTNGLSLPRLPSTCSFTQETSASHMSCTLPGTSLLTWRRGRTPSTTTTAPAISVDVTVSWVNVSRPM